MTETTGQALEALIARIAMRDRDAFSELYDQTAAKLLSVTLRVLKDRAQAEDVMQDAFIKVWNKSDQYRVTGHSPMTWLITIARNTAIDRLRSRKPEQDIDGVDFQLAAPGPNPEQSAVAASEAGRIVACLDELPTDRREAVTGAYLDGQSYKDLAERFDIPLNTIRTWLRRGLQTLRECMSR